MKTRARDRTRRSKPYSGPKVATKPGRYDGYPPNHQTRAIDINDVVLAITRHVFKREV